ncbi:hypothetical protein B296_00054572, partial [Ensete ventricosum]
MSKHRAGVRTMRLGTYLECVKSSPRVSGACQDGTRVFVGRRSRLVRRLSGVVERLAGSWEAMELQPDDGPRSSLSIGPEFRQCSGISPKFARRFDEGIGKLARNTPGDYRKKTIGLAARMSKAVKFTG